MHKTQSAREALYGTMYQTVYNISELIVHKDS
jgi:hypothetical protein